MASENLGDRAESVQIASRRTCSSESSGPSLLRRESTSLPVPTAFFANIGVNACLGHQHCLMWGHDSIVDLGAEAELQPDSACVEEQNLQHHRSWSDPNDSGALLMGQTVEDSSAILRRQSSNLPAPTSDFADSIPSMSTTSPASFSLSHSSGFGPAFVQQYTEYAKGGLYW
jgi:hypothetical protein